MSVDRTAVALDLIGIVLPYALHCDGAWCVHASAVQTPAGVIAFVAPRGTGKSTLAAACVQAGCALVADDVVVLHATAHGVSVTPAGVPMRLRAETAHAVGLAAADAESWGKVRIEATMAQDPLPLAAIYLLQPMTDDSVVERKPRATRAAALALLAHGKISELLGGDSGGDALGRCVALAHGAAVFDLAVPRSLSRLPDVTAQLLAWHGCAALRRGTSVIAGTNAAAITLRDVTKSFRADRGLWRRLRRAPGTAPHPVLDAVSLTVQRGEIFGLVGANGAGKTTLLKILSTVLLPDRGTATVDGLDVVAQAAVVRTRLAVVPADERALFWRVSATENVRLFASLYGLRGAEREAAVQRALELVGLEHAGQQQVGSFSSGMRQRTLIARALVTRPPILILDEPTRSLDPVTARELRRFIREVLCNRLGATIVLATHSTEEALQLCDRAALLVRGRVVATDSLSRLQAAVGGARVRARVDAAHEARARALLHLPTDVISPAIDGMVTLEATLPDLAHAPVVVEALVRAGVRVAEFAPVALTLADLLESAGVRAEPDAAVRHA